MALKALTIISLLALYLAAAGTAQADGPDSAAQHLYLGLRGGATLALDDDGKINDVLRDHGYSAQARTSNSSGLYGGYIGYWVTPHIAVEAGVDHLGSYDVRVSGAAVSDISRIAGDIKSLKPIGGRAEYLQVRFSTPLVDRFSLSSGIGIFFSQDSGSLMTPNSSTDLAKNRMGAVTDVSASYRLWRGLDLRAGWQAYVTTNFNLVNAFHGGVEFRFGQ